MNNIELVCILKPDLSKQHHNDINDRMEKSISKDGGKIIDQEIWGLKDLAYPIKKSKKGFYMFFQLNINSKNLEHLNQMLNLEESVIRHLAIKVDEHEKLPSTMAEQKK
tara:strand:+ start:37 stop:363 length:327 start_codon:yes stop_codon:yes gene_type:complete